MVDEDDVHKQNELRCVKSTVTGTYESVKCVYQELSSQCCLLGDSNGSGLDLRLGIKKSSNVMLATKDTSVHQVEIKTTAVDTLVYPYLWTSA